MPLLVRDVIEAARIRHWAFTDVTLGDGALVQFMNHRLRAMVLRNLAALRSTTNATVEVQSTIAGSLVAFTPAGVPYTDGAALDGYPVYLTDDGFPYIDTGEAEIVSADPFGIRGGKPGIPLPAESVAVIACTVTLADGRLASVDVVEATARHSPTQGRNLAVFLSGNRLMPLRRTTATDDLWTSVVSVQISYLPLPTLAALTDAIALPAPDRDGFAISFTGGLPYIDATATPVTRDPFGVRGGSSASLTVFADALIAATAERLAMQCQAVTPSERQGFADAARRAERDLEANALDLVGDLQTNTVIYRG